MIPSSHKISRGPAFVCALIIGGLSLFAGAGVYWLMGYSAGGSVPGEAYYRAVYVLQRLGGPASSETEDIPRRVMYADATESLLHHPDKILVLKLIAEDLAKAGRDRPRAALFEAYARLGLGQKEEAVELLSRYVIESPYQAGHYALLCGVLAELNDDDSLLIMSLEWQERDSSCREDRIRSTWAALHNLGRYFDAGAYMLGQQECLGDRAKVYAAKSFLAAGQAREAEALLREAFEASPASSEQIQRFWNILKSMQRV